MADPTRDLVAEAWGALGGAPALLDGLGFTGEGALPSAFAVTELAAASVGVAALAVAELAAEGGAASARASADRRLASFWFGGSIRPVDWTPAPIWDPIAGDYRAADGWIRLHTNAPHHRAAAQAVLGPFDDKQAMAAAVARWDAGELEGAIVAAGGCAAEMRSLEVWAAHPQGAAVAAEPLVARAATGHSPRKWRPTPGRPLAGVKVLDLTRVLAGPVGTRFLAGYGAEVLRIDPPGWNEAAVEPEVTLGKRCARLDLKAAADRAVFEDLLRQADVLVHGYRADALERLGYCAQVRRAMAPGLVDVSLCAYGWTGPWAKRRGFDSLVQMSTGVAEAGMGWKGAETPTPLPVQALDFATGYFIAAAAVRGLTERLRTGRGGEARLSLARTAKLLSEAGRGDDAALAPPTDADFAEAIEATGWGQARRLKAPHTVEGAPARWDLPASKLGWAEPHW